MNNYNIETLQELPLLQVVKQFLSPAECKEIIEYSQGRLVPSEVIRYEDGQQVVDYAIRSASTTFIPTDSELSNRVFEKVSNYLNISSSRFERLALTHYSTGQEFKLHPDYFATDKSITGPDSTAERCKFGGNRISTVIVYLNTVEEGGETHFPWLGKFIKPEQGDLVFFKYDYNDPELNVRTNHASVPVIAGEKYIFTIWIRETAIDQEYPAYKNFTTESEYLENLKSGEYELECGPEYDRQLLKVNLPANTDPCNTIVVPYTGGMDSSLVLYLLGALNNQQVIPYHIKPICIFEGDMENWNPLEDHSNVETMVELIQSKIGGNIRRPSFIPMEPGTKMTDAILGFYKKNTADLILNKSFRFFNPTLIYSGENALPTEDDHRWKDVPWSRTRSYSPIWIQPLFNLKKYHILDAIMQLGLEDILEHTSKCRHNHLSLDEICHYILCNERRWAFTKLGLSELGNKYFINKGEI